MVSDGGSNDATQTGASRKWIGLEVTWLTILGPKSGTTEQREACLREGRSSAFETVFSAADKPALVRRALVRQNASSDPCVDPGDGSWSPPRKDFVSNEETGVRGSGG